MMVMSVRHSGQSFVDFFFFPLALVFKGQFAGAKNSEDLVGAHNQYIITLLTD